MNEPTHEPQGPPTTDEEEMPSPEMDVAELIVRFEDTLGQLLLQRHWVVKTLEELERLGSVDDCLLKYYRGRKGWIDTAMGRLEGGRRRF